MIYYGIVDNLKDTQKKGIYGRKKIKTDDFIQIIEKVYNINKNSISGQIIINSIKINIFASAVAIATIELQNFFNIKNAPLELKSKVFGNEIIIENDLLLNNYTIKKNKTLFYGLFDNFNLNPKSVFGTIMKSGGGSTLVIIDKENAKMNYKHYSKKGIFSRGLYTTHPKDHEILIPLNRASELIKSFLLEETIRAYEALGAKEIIIEEKIILDTNASAEYKGVNAKVNAGKEREVLRKKVFGKGVFDVERALRDKKFIHDYPNIMSVIEARKNGNQLLEEFTEKINLNAGMDINVLNLFSSNISFNYQREWYFRVEFFDKIELL